jgi:hypothetical protein
VDDLEGVEKVFTGSMVALLDEEACWLAACRLSIGVAGCCGLVLQPEIVTWLVKLGRAGEQTRAATVDHLVL